MEWRSVRETGADELDKQLTIGENHDWSSLLETLLQNKLMIVLCSLLLNVVEESNRNVVAVVEEINGNVVVLGEKKL